MSFIENQIKQEVNGRWWREMLLWHPLMISFVMFCVSLGVYWHESYKDIAARMENRLPAFEERLDTWLEEITATFPKANPDFSESHHLPSRADVREIQENVTDLILGLNVVPTPTQGIENAAADFHLRLSEIIREIGRYDGTAEAFTGIASASHEAVRAGSAYNQEIDSYLGSRLKRLFGAF